MEPAPRLPFLPPETVPGVMSVDEVELGHPEAPLAPFKASRWELYPGQTSVLDVHDVKECWLVAAGEGELWFEGRPAGTVKAGDVLYYGSRQSHQITNTGTGNLLVFSVWWP